MEEIKRNEYTMVRTAHVFSVIAFSAIVFLAFITLLPLSCSMVLEESLTAADIITYVIFAAICTCYAIFLYSILTFAKKSRRTFLAVMLIIQGLMSLLNIGLEVMIAISLDINVSEDIFLIGSVVCHLLYIFIVAQMVARIFTKKHLEVVTSFIYIYIGINAISFIYVMALLFTPSLPSNEALDIATIVILVMIGLPFVVPIAATLPMTLLFAAKNQVFFENFVLNHPSTFFKAYKDQCRQRFEAKRLENKKEDVSPFSNTP